MRRTQNLGKIVEADPEIEKTFRRRRKQQRKKRAEQSLQAPNMANNNENRTLKDYAAPNAQGLHSGIARPAIEANNFELKPSLLSMVQQSQFGGLPTEDPNLHLSIFLEYCDTLKMHGVSSDAIRLRLFPFSLRDKARAWLHSLPPGSITTWDQLTQAFLNKYFPPSKTDHLRKQIVTFSQREDESLYEAWDRYKELLRSCPHHGVEKWLTVHIFYNGLNHQSKLSLDAAAGGAFMSKSLDEGYNLIESIAQNHYQWSSERSSAASKKVLGKYEVDTLTLLAQKVDALAHRFDKLSVNTASATNISCEICGVAGHVAATCQLGNSNPQNLEMAQVDAVNNFSGGFNSGHRNQPVFPYRGNQNQVGQGNFRQPPGFQQPQRSNLENLMETFVSTQMKQNEEFKHQMAEFKQQGQVVGEAIKQLTSKVDSLAVHNKMLETQLAQQAGSSSRPLGMFPGQPETNPNAHCNAIALRSGKQLEAPRQASEPCKDTPGDKKEEPKTSPVQGKETSEEKNEGYPYIPPPAYKPPIPFPQRLAKAKLDKQFSKFLQVLKKL